MSGSEIYASGNHDQLTYEEALKRSGKLGAHEFISAARQIDRDLGLETSHESALGYWKGGAEPSVVTKVKGDVDQDTLQAAAAMRGKVSDQDAVMTWMKDSDGPHVRYGVSLPDVPVKDAAAAVEKAGIENATISRDGKGSLVRVMHLDGDRSITDKKIFKLIQGREDADVIDQKGYGNLLERRQYDRVLKDYARGAGDTPDRGSRGSGDHSAPEQEPGQKGPVTTTGPPSAEQAGVHTSPGMSNERIRELVTQGHVAQKYSPAEIKLLLDAYDPSKLTDTERSLSAAVRAHFDETLANAQARGALNSEQAIQDYVTQLWQKEADNPAANKLVHQARMGEFNTQTPMAKQRIFQNAFEGQLLGKKLAITDPVALAAHNGNSFGRVIAARGALERLQAEGARASDGRPMVSLAGTGHIATDAEGNNSAALVNPFNMRNIRIADKVVAGFKSSGDPFSKKKPT